MDTLSLLLRSDKIKWAKFAKSYLPRSSLFILMTHSRYTTLLAEIYVRSSSYSNLKQLGIATWFMTLSCVGLRQPELFQVIDKRQPKNMTEKQVNALSYNKRCSLLNLSPVIVSYN